MAAVVSFGIVALYAWTYFSHLNGSRGHASYLPILCAAIALISGVYSLFAHRFTPTPKLQVSVLLSYLLVLTSIGTVVATTGGLTSPFITLWIGAITFSAIFGGIGVIAAFASFAAYEVAIFLSGDFSIAQLLNALLVGAVPIFVGLILWGRDDTQPTKEETSEDRSYHQLAHELTQVAGKAEIVINAISEGVVALDGQGVIKLINPAAQALVGWNQHDAVNLNYRSVLKLYDAKNEPANEINDPIAKTLSTNQQAKTELLSLETQNGKKFLASISSSPIGQIGMGTIVVFRDITTEKSDERQRAEFISTASHEMRTPVASIEGYLGLALNPATATIDEKARDYILKAHESAQHLGNLFQDLLDVSKADDGRLKNNPKVLDIIPFVKEIVRSFEDKAKQKGLRLFFKPMPDDTVDDSRAMNPVYYVHVDNDHLREIVSNLVENAIKYTLKGEVVVDITGDSSKVDISVADTGIGIPAEDQTHLFQKFYRIDNSDTREIGGTGLGLYLCRRLTEAIGGRIWVDSQYKRGSTFYIELPRLDHEEATALIEKAGIEAERQAEAEARAAQLGGSMPLAAIQATHTMQAAAPAINTPVSYSPPATLSTPPAPAIAQALSAPISAAAQPIQYPVPPQSTVSQTAVAARPPVAAPLPRMQGAVTYQPPPTPGPTLSAIEANPRQFVMQAASPPAATPTS